MHERRYWFRKKRFGIGWSPATPEGWATLLALLALEAVGSLVIDARTEGNATVAKRFHIACALAIVTIVAVTGEPLDSR